jgi:membrane-associated protease RseP (regulator of RpoE activity)
VEKGSRAEKAGFHAGDVILRVNGESIHDAGDFSRALRGHKESSVSVGIIRDKKEQTLTLSLPERKESERFEESVDVPEIDAETRRELSQASAELAQLKPQMELAAREVQRLKPELKRQARELWRQKQEVQRQVNEQVRQLKLELPHQKEQLLEQLRDQLRRMRSGRADI